jgi:hypothetical protein
MEELFVSVTGYKRALMMIKGKDKVAPVLK